MIRSDTEEGLVQCKLRKHMWVCGSEMNRLGCSSVQSCKITRQLKKEQERKRKFRSVEELVGKEPCSETQEQSVSRFSTVSTHLAIWTLLLSYDDLYRDRK